MQKIKIPDGEIVTVRCSSVPQEMPRGSLFSHESWTGAVRVEFAGRTLDQISPNENYYFDIHTAEVVIIEE